MEGFCLSARPALPAFLPPSSVRPPSAGVSLTVVVLLAKGEQVARASEGAVKMKVVVL